ncbi:hypothetical protein DL93DRAFT_2159209 [Clavulina sp. PMI_390]|nr:hypothetical protein DL93DRAFT_2159209 [Clavulina sp. PMI_390]
MSALRTASVYRLQRSKVTQLVELMEGSDPSSSSTHDDDVAESIKDVRDWFSDDQGNCPIDFSDQTSSRSSIEQPRLVPRSRLSVTRSLSIKRVDTQTTVHTVVPQSGTILLSLRAVCDYVDKEETLQTAAIISSECYAETSSAVTHRFVVLELYRPRRKGIWLRLDRRRGENVSTGRFLATFGITKANDQAMLSSVKSCLVGTAIQENKKVFPDPTSLKELCRLLRIIIDELGSYRIWPQYLGGIFVHGAPTYASLALDLRTRVFLRMWGGADGSVPQLPAIANAEKPEGSHLSSSICNSSAGGNDAIGQIPCSSSHPPSYNSSRIFLEEFMIHLGPPQLELPPSQASSFTHSVFQSVLGLPDIPGSISTSPPHSSGNTHPSHEPSGYGYILEYNRLHPFYEGASRELVSKMLELSSNLRPDMTDVRSKVKQAMELAPGIVIMESISQSMRKRANKFLKLINDINGILHDGKQTRAEDALPLQLDAVRLQRALFKEVPLKNQSELYRLLHNLAFSLYKHNKVTMACAVAEEALTILREWNRASQSIERNRLPSFLYNYSVWLFRDNRHYEGLTACQEAVMIWRGLRNATDSGKYSHLLARALQHLGQAFVLAQRFEDARAVEEEALFLWRSLYHVSRKRSREYRDGYLRCLDRCISLMKDLGLPVEARKLLSERSSSRVSMAERYGDNALLSDRSSLGVVTHSAYEDYLRASSPYGVINITAAPLEVSQSPPSNQSGLYQFYPHSLQHWNPPESYDGPVAELLEILHEVGAAWTNTNDLLTAYATQALVLAPSITTLYPSTIASRMRGDQFLDIIDNIGDYLEEMSETNHKRHITVIRGEAVRLQRALLDDLSLSSRGELEKLLVKQLRLLPRQGAGNEVCELHKELLAIRREYYRRRPSVHRFRLAVQLSRYSIVLFREKRREEAFQACEEALGLSRLLYQFEPDQFIGLLAKSLDNIGMQASALQRFEDARIVEEERLVLHRILYEADREENCGPLLHCLRNYIQALRALGLTSEARILMDEYNSMRALVASHGDTMQADRPRLEDDVHITYGDYVLEAPTFGAMSDNDAPVGLELFPTPTSHQPGFELYEKLHEVIADKNITNQVVKEKATELINVFPDVLLVYPITNGSKGTAHRICDLLKEICVLLETLSEIDQNRYLLVFRGQLINLRRALLSGLPVHRRKGLVQLLCKHALTLKRLEHGSEACNIQKEAVGILRECYRLHPGAERYGLAKQLNAYLSVLYNERRYEEAVWVCKEAIGLIRLLYQADPDAFIKLLANSLHNLGMCLEMVERPGGARIVQEEELVLRRTLYEKNPESEHHRRNLLVCLKCYLLTLRQLHLSEVAKAVLAQFIPLLEPVLEP